MPNPYLKSTFSEQFFKPIFDAYQLSQARYNCHSYSDLEHLKVGIFRCLSQAQSGRDFLQEQGDFQSTSLSVDLFFKSLKSKRRLANISSVNDLLREPLSHKINDPFAEFKSLDKWDIYAVDGHYQEHATHDPIHITRGKESRPATGQFCRLNLRTHHMSLLDTTQPEFGRKKEHDAKLIKRMTADQLRYGASKGRKVMLVWDKACIDYRTWSKLKAQHGVYFITMEKSNSSAMNNSGDICDHSTPQNEGIVKEQYIGVAGESMRRVVYKNPTDNKEYTYITNDFSIPAFLLVTFYKHRWDIEKVYYQFKSKFCERKSWASGVTAKQAHATFQCLLHNLALLMEQEVEDNGLIDEVSARRAKGRKRVPQQGFINKIVQRASHRTFVFIRWLRNHLRNKASYSQAISRLNHLYTREI